ncbi:DUF397 domain-containing protein [Streptomyces sp. NPDC026206]|uniref:DUF397 domain-containing protein n=1 Tax=Streptomyces sp. NPDC026206 TaxID=3157089 RepID=UPI0033E2C25D
MSRVEWHKSSYSSGGDGECLEVAPAPGGLIRFRESDCPTQVIAATPATFASLLATVKAGRLPAWLKSSYSVGSDGSCVEVAPAPDGLIHLRESDNPADVITTTPATLATLLTTVKAERLGSRSRRPVAP